MYNGIRIGSVHKGEKMSQDIGQNGRTFKLKYGWYNLSHSRGDWRLVRVTDGKLHDKTEITCKSDEAVFKYLAAGERCTTKEARSAYENTKKTV